jgi:hypothetical protein
MGNLKNKRKRAPCHLPKLVEDCPNGCQCENLQLCNIGVEFLETQDTNGDEGVGVVANMITNDLYALKGVEKVLGGCEIRKAYKGVGTRANMNANNLSLEGEEEVLYYFEKRKTYNKLYQHRYRRR